MLAAKPAKKRCSRPRSTHTRWSCAPVATTKSSGAGSTLGSMRRSTRSPRSCETRRDCGRRNWAYWPSRRRKSGGGGVAGDDVGVPDVDEDDRCFTDGNADLPLFIVEVGFDAFDAGLGLALV